MFLEPSICSTILRFKRDSSFLYLELIPLIAPMTFVGVVFILYAISDV